LVINVQSIHDARSEKRQVKRRMFDKIMYVARKSYIIL